MLCAVSSAELTCVICYAHADNFFAHFFYYYVAHREVYDRLDEWQRKERCRKMHYQRVGPSVVGRIAETKLTDSVRTLGNVPASMNLDGTIDDYDIADMGVEMDTDDHTHGADMVDPSAHQLDVSYSKAAAAFPSCFQELRTGTTADIIAPIT